MHSFLLIGQSNMAGRGYLEEAHEIDSHRIYTLRNGRWQTMFRPINPDRSFSGVSLAESFAEAYAQKHDVDVGLICCADGGTSLDQWKVGDVLLDHAICQAKLAMRSSQIVGVLWHQGDADCAPELSAAYQQRFETIMGHLRQELQLQDVPFLLGGLGDFLKDCTLNKNLKYYADVNIALQKIAQNNPMTGFVSAEGLEANPDNLHFSAPSLYAFGLRYLEVFESLSPNDKNRYDLAVDLHRSEMEKL